MKFHKYQALGNDYVVLETADGGNLTPAFVRRMCDRHFGIGSDGILVGGPTLPDGTFALRIFNPDGSEAEKSGNGLRIFARYLWDSGQVGGEYFSVTTKGGTVACQVREAGQLVFVEMGQASFDSSRIPVTGPRREVVGEDIAVGGERFRFTGVSLGNPHCVIHCDEISSSMTRRLGPLLEVHELFPARTNVQFVKVIDAHRIQIEIWERGAGYTLASGSSSCAAASASVKLGFCTGNVIVAMPGGALQIGVAGDFSVTMLGPAAKVAEGTLSRELLENARAVVPA